MSELSTYSGSCHCGAVRYRARLDLKGSIVSCNCSMCGRSGTLLTFVPESQFTLEAGADVLSDYQFNRQVIHHLFCRTCGIKPFARGVAPDGSPMVAVNVRCLDGVDLNALSLTQYDGKST